MPFPSTLFLDRDGVINFRPPAAYVTQWSEFHFLAGVLEALALLAPLAARILIVTNQQGIGKGLMTEAGLRVLHDSMLQEIDAAGGRIDGVYHCPDLAAKPNNCRKPSPDLALRAQRDFPDIDFADSLMVGDSLSDLQFGRQLGMQVALITSDAESRQLALEHPESYDLCFSSLLELVRSLRSSLHDQF